MSDLRAILRRIEGLRELENQTLDAYERGDFISAERLDAQYAHATENFESELDELNFEGESRTGHEDIGYRDFYELIQRFALVYHEYLYWQSFRSAYGLEDGETPPTMISRRYRGDYLAYSDSEADVAQVFREQAQAHERYGDIGPFLGQTDAELIAAGKDAYERWLNLKARSKKIHYTEV